MKKTYLQTIQEKKLKKLVFNHLDNIYISLNKICKSWETRTIPLNTIEETINLAKFKLEELQEEHIEFATAFNLTLDDLYNWLKAIAKNMESTKVPISEVKKGIETIKISFTKID